MKRLLALATSLAVAAALPALGQTPAPATAPAAAPSATATTPATPKPNCGNKPEHPGKLASDNMKRAWQRDANTYLECLRKFAGDQQQLAQEYIKAANATVDEYNSAVKEFQAAAQNAAN